MALVLPIVAIVLGQTDVIPNGMLVSTDNANGEFVAQVSTILSTLIMVPLALKLFSLNTKSNLHRYTLDGAVDAYRAWSIVRQALLSVCCMVGIVAHYLTLTSQGLLCAAICYVVLLACAPSKKKIETYLENSKNAAE